MDKDIQNEQEGLTEYELMIRALLDNTQNYVFTVNHALMVMSYNRLLPGVSIQDSLSLSIDDIIPPALRERFTEEVTFAFGEEQEREMKFDLKTPEGVKNYQCKISPIKGEGSVLATIVTISDVTSANNLELENKKLKQELVRALEKLRSGSEEIESKKNQEIKNLKKEIETIVSDRDSLQKKASDCQDEAGKLKEEISKKSDENKILQEQILSLKTETTADNFKSENKSLRQERDGMKIKLENISAELSAKKEELDQEKKKEAELISQLKEEERQLHKLQITEGKKRIEDWLSEMIKKTRFEKE
jgi:DNA repair exonuclease SbcCD ATPase subunit